MIRAPVKARIGSRSHWRVKRECSIYAYSRVRAMSNPGHLVWPARRASMLAGGHQPEPYTTVDAPQAGEKAPEAAGAQPQAGSEDSTGEAAAIALLNAEKLSPKELRHEKALAR